MKKQFRSLSSCSRGDSGEGSSETGAPSRKCVSLLCYLLCHLLYHDPVAVAHQVRDIQVTAFVVREKQHRARHIIRFAELAQWFTGERD